MSEEGLEAAFKYVQEIYKDSQGRYSKKLLNKIHRHPMLMHPIANGEGDKEHLLPRLCTSCVFTAEEREIMFANKELSKFAKASYDMHMFYWKVMMNRYA